MPSCICINSQKKIILILFNFNNTIKIPTLKSRLKYNLLIIKRRIHPFKGSIINLIFKKPIMSHRILRYIKSYMYKAIISKYSSLIKIITLFLHILLNLLLAGISRIGKFSMPLKAIIPSWSEVYYPLFIF